MALRYPWRTLGFVAVPLAVLAVSACGGGGGGSTPAVPSTPAALSTPTPAPNPTASGSAFTYAGTLSQTVTLNGTPAPAPGPTSTPWVTTTSQTVTQNVSVSTGATFGGTSGLTDFTTQETDAGQLQTTSVKSDTYLSFASNTSRVNGEDVSEAGISSTDSNGVALKSVPAAGNGVVEQMPYTLGMQWMNTAARTDTENDPGGETNVSTYAADGSYNATYAYPEGRSSMLQVLSDGSGTYQIPLFGGFFLPSTLIVAAPSGGQIQVAIETEGQYPQAAAFTVPVWYPQTPPVLASDTFVDEGSSTAPSSCGMNATYQSASAEKIVETKMRLDPLLGELETDNITQYASSSYGLLCEVVSDDLKNYYDFSGQAGAIFAFGSPGAPMSETTVSETLALQSMHSATASAVHRGPQTMSQAILPRPSLARVRMIIAAAHAHLLTRQPK